jgi:hypothetical protein
MKQASDYWEAKQAPAIFRLDDLQKGKFSEKVHSIIEAISEGDCQNCLTRAKLNLYTEVIKGNISPLEGTLLDLFLQDAVNLAIDFWLQEFLNSAEGGPSEDEISQYLEHLELFEMQMAISFIESSN